jgi:uncharacterized protein YjdB
MLAEQIGIGIDDITVFQNLDDIIEVEGEAAECFDYMTAFQKKLAKATEKTEKGIYEYLTIICSFHLKNEPLEPFGPRFQGNGKRDFIPVDLKNSPQDKLILEELSKKTKSNELLARLSDTIWLISNDYKYAEKAMSCYFLSGKNLVNNDTWTDGVKRLERSYIISKQINHKDIRKEIIEFYIVSSKNLIDKEEKSFYPLKMTEILIEQKEFKPYYHDATNICLAMAEIAKKAENLHMVGEYYDILGDLNTSDNSEYTKQLAENEYEQANIFLSCEKPNWMLAAHHLSKAFEIYKNIPGERERRNEIYAALLKAQAEIPKNLKVIKQEIDLTRICAPFEKKIKGKDFLDSLFVFFEAFGSPTQESKDHFCKSRSIFSILAKSTKLDKTGKTIAIQKGLGEGEEETKIKQNGFEHGQLWWSITVQSYLSIFLNHVNSLPFDKSDIWNLVNNNPIIPPGREEIIFNGIYFGLKYDFISAIHLLIPQIENIFRSLLYEHGVITSYMKDDGTQEYYEINIFFNEEREFRPVLNSIFTNDIMFDLEALLIGRFGANLRNRVAHGLMNFDELNTPAVPYLYGLLLKLFTCGFLFTKINRPEEEEDLNP